MGTSGRKLWKWWQKRSRSRGRDLFMFFSLLALLPRLLVFNIAIHRERPVYRYQDSLGYIIPAQSLAEGKGFQGGGGWPAFWWPPGYSGFLSLTFAAGIASPTILWLMAFAGLVGLLPLVRPVATYLWVPLALLLVFARPASVARGRALVAFVALATLPASAWTLRNYSYLHVPIFATVGQLNEAKFARAVEDLAEEPRAASPVRQPWQDDFGPDQGMSFPRIVKAREDYLR